MGGDDDWAYDNERPAHEAETGAFRIDVEPVSNGDYAAFLADGGWPEPPLSWERDGPAWRAAPLRATSSPSPHFEPVQHVSLGRGERIRRVGGQAPADRGRVGARGEARRRSAASARSGSGRRPTSPATRASGRSRTAEYSEVFFGPEHKVLRGGVLGDEPDGRPRDVSQLGLPHPPADLRRLPLRERHVSDGAPPRPRCRSTSTSRRRTASMPCARTSAGASRRRRRSCRRSGSTTSAARSSSRRSRGCPSTTPPGASAIILAERADDVATLTAANTLVEPGSGIVREDAAPARRDGRGRTPRRFVPFDVSEQALREAARGDRRRSTRASRSTASSATSSAISSGCPRAAGGSFAFLGSPIGNLTGAQRAAFLARPPRAARPRRGARCSAPTSSRTRRGSRRRTTTRAA